MSLLPNQTLITEDKPFYAGAFVNTYIPTNASAVIPTPNIASIAIDQRVLTLSSNFYPTVGKTYQINMNYTYSMDLSGSLAGTDSVNLGMSYSSSNTSNIYNFARNCVVPVAENTTLYGSVTLTFNHTDPTNVVDVRITNLTPAEIVGSNSGFQVYGITSLELSSAPVITTAVPLS